MDFIVPGISLVFIPVVPWLLIPDSYLVPDEDRSTPCVFLLDAYGKGRSWSGFFGLLAALMNP